MGEVGGHGNWQLSTCVENRDPQKRAPTKNTGTPWTRDKHFLWGDNGPAFTFQSPCKKKDSELTLCVGASVRPHLSLTCIWWQPLNHFQSTQDHRRLILSTIGSCAVAFKAKHTKFFFGRAQGDKMPPRNNAPLSCSSENFFFGLHATKQERSCRFL